MRVGERERESKNKNVSFSRSRRTTRKEKEREKERETFRTYPTRHPHAIRDIENFEDGQQHTVQDIQPNVRNLLLITTKQCEKPFQ